MGHTCGRDMSRTTQKWHEEYDEQTRHHIRWMNEAATHLDHLMRMVRELEHADGDESNDNINEARTELEEIGNGWEVRRDETKGEIEFPLLTNGGWEMISEISDLMWGNWMGVVREEKWAYLAEMGEPSRNRRYVGRHRANDKCQDKDSGRNRYKRRRTK